MGWWTGAKQAIKDCKLANKRHQELHDETVKHLERYREMVRPLTRDERIRCVMEDNKNSVHPFERTEGYAAAYVNGQISIEERNKFKMTREEAISLVNKNVFGIVNTGQAAKWVDTFEALGLIKFDEPKRLPSMELNRDNFFGDYGLIRLERWPEGLVIWVGGEIVYKSWKP